MSFKFSPSDFDSCSIGVPSGMGTVPMISPNKCAEVANAKLDEWLSTGVKVYGHSSNLKDWHYCKERTSWDDKLKVASTHEALLINIKPIERECTEHEPMDALLVTPAHKLLFCPELKSPEAIKICRKCKRKLKAKWEVADE